MSANHRFWGRRNSNPQRTRNLSAPTWILVDDPEITERWYWASPTEFPDADLTLDELPTPSMDQPWTDDQGFRRRNIVETPLTVEILPVLFTLTGRYLADGNLALRGDRPVNVAFTDDEKGILEIEGLARLLGFRATRRRHDNAHCTVISHTAFCTWLEREFGRLSDGKQLPGWMLGAPKPLRQALLDGYLAGDGHGSQARQRWEFGTASKRLALGLKLLAQSLGYGTSFSWADPKVDQIGGVPLKSTPKRSYRVQLTDPARGNAIIEDGFLWGKIRKVTPAARREVLDFVVAEDFSYVGDGIVHKGSRFLPSDDEVL